MTGAPDRPLLRSESRYRFRVLGIRERPVFEWYGHLRTGVGSRLGDRFAHFFAEPAADPSGDTIDWYAPVPGTAVPLDALEGESAERAEGEVAEILDGLRGLGSELRGSSREDERALGEVLESALFFPDREQVFLVGDQPVVMHWGFAPSGREAPITPLFRRAPAGGAPLAAGGRGALFAAWPWLTALLLLLLLPLWWFRGCGEPERQLEAAVSPDAKRLADLMERHRALRTELEREKRQYDAVLERCDPAPRVARRARVGSDGWVHWERGPAGAGSVRAVPIDVAAAEAAGLGSVPGEEAASGAVEEISPTPETPLEPESSLPDVAAPGEETPPPGEQIAALDPPEGEPEEAPGSVGEPGSPTEPDAGTPLEVPPDLEPGSAPSFFSGRWRSLTEFTEEGGATGERIQMEYDFDGSGRGSISLRQGDGTVCRGPARAEVVEGGRLRIAGEGARCPDGTRYGSLDVLCETRGAGGASCQAEQEGGQRFPLEIKR